MPTPSTDDALALHRAGHLAAAERIYRQTLEAFPDHFDSLQLLGVVCGQRGLHSEAIRYFDAALAKKPTDISAHNNRGVALIELKRFDEALASFEQVLAHNPGHVDALGNRGRVLAELQRLDEAAAAFNARGIALRGQGRWDEALASFRTAITLAPENAVPLYNLGNALHALRRFDEALASYDRAIALNPKYAMAFNDRGTALHELELFEAALASYDRALALEPGLAMAFNNRGATLTALNRLDGALRSFERAVALMSDYGDAHWNLALSCLHVGDFERGWKEFEWRWRANWFRGAARNFRQPLWRGSENLTGKCILLHAEQGFGDTIQFCRYVPLVAERGARVILEVQPSLQRLLSRLVGADVALARGEPLPDFDFQCPLLSLPHAFATRLATIPTQRQPMKAPADTMQKWEARLGPRTKLRVGLVWSGRPEHPNDCNRSIPLSTMLPLFGLPVQFVSLQTDIRKEDQRVLAAHAINVAHFGSELTDFLETAALTSLMDVVITVDTAVAHLAASLARPTWILLPFVADWRWLRDRDDSPWYPTAQLFRQPQMGDWDSVLQQLADKLPQLM